jgi:uncharacterized protein YndB with AHSA1/START domain
MEKTIITVEATIAAPIEKVWEMWTKPSHIIHWNNASSDWHTTFAENNLRTDGKFRYRMAAKDRSFSFDFEGIYTDVKTNAFIAYTMLDDRKADITFAKSGKKVKIIENFDAETENPIEMQQAGWQAILNNFKKYVETH